MPLTAVENVDTNGVEHQKENALQDSVSVVVEEFEEGAHLGRGRYTWPAGGCGIVVNVVNTDADLD